MRPNYNDALAYMHRHQRCPDCNEILVNLEDISFHWQRGHFDGITEADCHTPMSQPAPVYTGVHMTAGMFKFTLALIGILGFLVGIVAKGLVK